MLKSPFHPGHFLKQLLAEHQLSQARLARHIGVGVGVINQVCNEKRALSAGMALKLAGAFGTSPEFWLNLQTAYDLNRADSRRPIKPLIRVA
jgi:addiction module HigA family antidote